MLTREEIELAFEREWLLKRFLIVAFAFSEEEEAFIKQMYKNWFLAGIMLEENEDG